MYGFFVYLFQAEIFAEIGEVISGTKEARRNETTVFKSVGMYFINNWFERRVFYDI